MKNAALYRTISHLFVLASCVTCGFGNRRETLAPTAAATPTAGSRNDPGSVTGGSGTTAGSQVPGGASTTTTGGAPDPGVEGDGNYAIGPTYEHDPRMAQRNDVPHGTLHHFTLNSADSKIFTGGQAPFSRDVWLYMPAQYVAGSAAPFIVAQDGGNSMDLTTVLDNLIADKKLPVMLAVLINPGPDGNRNWEYDSVSAAYVSFIDTEVLPHIEAHFPVKFTTDPAGRATMGGSSGGAAAFTMAWFRPDLYSRVLTYSGSFTKLQSNDQYPHGAWGYHENLIAQSPAKNLRVFLEVGDMDLNTDPDGYHDWPAANMHMADALQKKGYHYRFLFAKNAKHVDYDVRLQTLPDALIWLWRGFPIAN